MRAPLVMVAALLATAALVACRPQAPVTPVIGFGPLGGRAADGHAEARRVLRERGCIYCHRVDGVTGGWQGRVGPPLLDLHERVYTSSIAPDDEVLLIRFIVAPHSVRPDTAMPVTGITAEEARAVVDFLYARR